MSKRMSRICNALENRQEDHQNSIVEIGGMIKNQPISVLIDPGTRMSYISHGVVDLRNLVPKMFDNSFIVQLDIGTKRKVTSIVRN